MIRRHLRLFRRRTSFLADSEEGRILRTGLLLAAAVLVGFGIGWAFLPDWTLVVAAMTGLNLLIGRAAGMSFGFGSGLDTTLVIACNVLVETIQVLIVYPLFVLSWQNLLDVRRLKPFLQRMRHSAEGSRPWVQRFGMAGLFLFVFLPFWMTGPVVGSVIGFLLGLKPRVNLAVVLSATYVAIGVWAVLFNQLDELTTRYNRYAAFFIVLAVLAVAVAWRLVSQWHRPRQERRRSGASRDSAM